MASTTSSQNLIYKTIANQMKIDFNNPNKTTAPSFVSKAVSKNPNMGYFETNLLKRTTEKVNATLPTQTLPRMLPAAPNQFPPSPNVPAANLPPPNMPPPKAPSQNELSEAEFDHDAPPSIDEEDDDERDYSHEHSSSHRPNSRSIVRSHRSMGESEEVRRFYMDKMKELIEENGGIFDRERQARYQQMSLRDLQFLYTKNKTDIDTKSTVAFMKDMVRFGMSGIESLNQYFGPWMNLKGWAKDSTRDMSRYNNALSKIYKRYWRHGSVNPFIELGMLIVGSAIIYHWQGKGSDPVPTIKEVPQPQSFDDFPTRAASDSKFRRSMQPPNIPGGQPSTPEPADSGLMGMFGGGGGGGDMLSSLLPMIMKMSK